MVPAGDKAWELDGRAFSEFENGEKNAAAVELPARDEHELEGQELERRG
jgi:hypothetical protein